MIRRRGNAAPVRHAGLELALVLAVAGLPDLGAASRAPDPGPWLIFDVAKSLYATENQGGNFVVEVKHAGGREIVHRVVWGAESGVWLPQAVNLRDYAGQSIKIRLQSIAAYYFSSACFLFWGGPRVVLGPLDGLESPVLVADLAENFRQGRDCRRYILDAEHSGPLKTDRWDFTGGYYDYGQAGPWAEPALFGHPFCYGYHSWAGFEFDVALPKRPEVPNPGEAVRKPQVTDLGPVIPVFWWEQQVYRAMRGGLARFDTATMRLETRMPRTDHGFGYAFAGFETKGCNTVWLRAEYDDYQPWAGYGEMEDNRFVGVVLDYHTANGYTRRAWLHYPPMRPRYPKHRSERRAPTWHMDLSRPRRVSEVNWEQTHADLPPGQVFGLDLQRWAPPDWDGRFWFGIGIQDAGSERKFAVAVLDRKAGQ